MSRWARRPTFADSAVSSVRIDWAVRPSLPMTLPMSSFATRSSMTVLCSPETSVTSTWSGWSTSSTAMARMSSLRGMSTSATLGLLGLGRGGRSRRDAGLTLEQLVDRGRRRGAVTAPVREALAVDGEVLGSPGRVVGTDVLEETTSPGTPVVGHDDAVEGALLGAGPGETDMNGHR